MKRLLLGLVLRRVRRRLLGNGGICGSDLDYSSLFHQELDDRGAFTYHRVEAWCGKEIRTFLERREQASNIKAVFAFPAADEVTDE